jgi:Tol biopolymer transport system component
VGFDFVAGTGAANLPIAVSPDGRQLAMVARSGEGRTTLWIRSLDSATARELGGTDGATAPFWSPDGRFLAFYADGKLKKIAAAGGPAVTLCSASSFNSGAWSSLGVIVFARAGGSGVGGALLRVADSGGEPVTATTLATGEVLHIRPAFLPDGRHFFYRATSQAGGGGIFIASLDSADRRRILTEGVGNVQYSRGHLLFVRDTTLFAQPFDARSLVITGDPRPVAESVQTNGQGVPVGDFSVTDAGVLAYQTGNPAETGSELTWFDRAGKVLGTVGNRAAYWDLELSPDGQQASVSIRRPQGDTDIWIVDLVRNVPTRFTFNQGLIQNRSIWSPDGRRIVFSAGRVALADQGDARGGLTLFEKPTAGGPERPLPATSQDKTQALLLPWSWSPDGRAIVYSSTSGQNGPSNLWVLPLSGGEPAPLLPSKFTHAYGRLSPDGHSLTFASNESGELQVYVVPFPDTTSAKIQISTAGGSEPRWRGDGKEIFYLDVNTLMAADVSVDHSQLKVGLPKRLFQFRYTGLPRSNYAVTPDGQRFLFITRAEASLSEPITVVVNWDRQP